MNDSDDFYARIPERQTHSSASAALASLADALGYRYYWASHGLPEDALEFRATAESQSIHELLRHMRDLVGWIRLTLTRERGDRDTIELDALRRQTLAWTAEVAERLAAMSADELDAVRIQSHRGGEAQRLRNVVHGPLADFLTHVGQLNVWRRQAGCPAPAARVFLGLPPE